MDLTTLDFGVVKKDDRREFVRTQSGLIVPPRTRKNSKNGFKDSQSSLVRTQSGQIVPPRLKKSRSCLKSETTSKEHKNCLDKVPPTPPKRKKHLQIEKINQLFMNFVNFNGQERMQLGMESIGKFNLNQCMC